MKTQLYPLKFTPIIIEKVWGGNKLQTLLHKNSGNNAGESWEISTVSNTVSEVANGILKGYTLTDLVKKFGADLLGKKVFKRHGNNFPLLFKFIDANKDLSIQLHPNDKLAKKRHNSFGKTEMWYVMQAEEGARLILGFEKDSNKEEYQAKLSEEKITEILREEPVKEGDSFYITPGTVHAIGEGVLLAEIQQTSDITYRIYDWNRPDSDGKLRELHTDLALDAIDYKASNAQLSYEEKPNELILLKESPFFKTYKLTLTKDFERDLIGLDSFVVYMCLDGQGVVSTENASESLVKGETLLIPAYLSNLKIESSNITLLEVSIP